MKSDAMKSPLGRVVSCSPEGGDPKLLARNALKEHRIVLINLDWSMSAGDRQALTRIAHRVLGGTVR